MALSGAIACSLVSSFSASATVTALPVASAGMSVAQSRSELLAALPRGMDLHYLSTLAPLYAANHMQPMWQDREAVQQFQQQLAELAMSGVQPQFTQWVKMLTDPALSEGPRCGAVRCDAGLFTVRLCHRCQRQQLAVQQYSLQAWLAAHRGDQPMATGGAPCAYPELCEFARAAASAIRQDAPALRDMLADNRPWPQVGSGPSLRPAK
ncbi:hypothetical protein J4732_12730 [Serratia marcescens]|uniref:Uncharacterized protein n=1 Tax=Serratia marcescens TaxID=615 RepID=A0A939NK28_SERMA|nr:hypothetical protein [Serratia marcescens]